MAYLLVFGTSTEYGAWDFKKQGWVNRLRIFLDKDVVPGKKFNLVYNMGVSGYTSKDGMEYF